MRSRPTRPFPSRNGWIVSNWTWARAALMSTGVAGSWPRAAEPDLRPPELAWVLVRSASAAEQDAVDLADEPEREREPLLQPGEPVVEGRDVARHLGDIVERNARRVRTLVEQQVAQRRLRPFDLRREQRLFADVEVDEQIPVREEPRDSVEPPEGAVGPLHQVVVGRTEGERRRERIGDERAYRLAARSRRPVGPCGDGREHWNRRDLQSVLPNINYRAKLCIFGIPQTPRGRAPVGTGRVLQASQRAPPPPDP